MRQVRVRDEWQQTLPRKAFYLSVLGVAAVLGAIGVYSLSLGGRSGDLPPAVSYGLLTFVGVSAVIGYVRFGKRAFPPLGIVSLLGSVAFLSSQIVPKNSPLHSPLEWGGICLMMAWFLGSLMTVKKPGAS